VRRRPKIATERLSDEELLAAEAEWRARNPRPREDGDPYMAWLDQWRAWCVEHGTDSVEVLRLRGRRTLGNLRWVAEQEGREWGGVDVPVSPPTPPDLTLWRCPGCGATTMPHEGCATLCVPCLRARAGLL
jgi:hypothetical protein